MVRQEDRGGDLNVFGKNLSTGREFRVTANDREQVSPAVDGGVVVWTDWRRGNADIFGRNLATRTSSSVAAGERPQESPAISGDTVVWESQCTGEPNFGVWDIFGATL